MAPRFEKAPISQADRIGSVDIASDGASTASQESVRGEAQAWLARERDCVTPETYSAIEARVAEMLASQEAERLDLESEFDLIRREILSRTQDGVGALAREESIAQLGLAALPDRYAPVETYYGLDTATVAAIRQIEHDTGLAVMPALARYQSMIERTLTREADSSLPETRVIELRASMRRIVAARAAEIPDIVADRAREDADGRRHIEREDRWIINGDITSAFADIEQRLLPEARWYLQMHEAGYTEALHGAKEYTDAEALSERYGTGRSALTERMDARLAEAEHTLFDGDSLWSSVRRAGVSTMNRLDKNAKYHNDTIESLALPGQASPWKEAKRDRTEFLSEGDRTIEEDATIACVVACVCQMTPYAGAALSVVTDAEDVFAGYDATTRWLQRCGIVDPSYRPDKGFMDKVFALVGLVGAVAGAQALGKIPKIARGLEKLGQMGHRITPGRVEAMFRRISAAAEMTREATAAEKRGAGVAGDMEEGAEAVARTSEDTGRASERGVETETMSTRRSQLPERLPIAERNSHLPDAERLEEASKLLGRTISIEQCQAILAVHHAVSK